MESATIKDQCTAQIAEDLAVRSQTRNIRVWFPTVVVMLGTTLSYIDRNALAICAPSILKELHLSGTEYGFVVSGFSLAYMVTNPVWGFLFDRIGIKRGFGLAVSLWSLVSFLHAFVRGMFSLSFLRGALGAAEGATFPGATKTVVETLPQGQQARGTAVALSGGSLGALLAPILVTPIAVRFGWRAAFLVTGLAGSAWLILWMIVCRGMGSAQHSAPRAAAAVERVRIRFSDSRLWAFISFYSCGAFPLAVGLYACPLYLSRVHHLSQAAVGTWLIVPPLGWELGYLVWGIVCDKFVGGGSPARWIMLLGLASSVIVLVPLSTVAATTMAFFFFAMFVAGGVIVFALRYAVRVFSEQNTALMTGIGAGAWSAVVAVLMPVVGRLFDHGRYDVIFLITAIMPVIGMAGWMLLGATRHADAGYEKAI